MADTERDKLLDELEPYRGRQSALAKELGQPGVYLLWRLCHGSPTEGAEFLGYNARSGGRSVVATLYTQAQLPIAKAAGWTKRHGEDAEAAQSAFSGERTVEQRRDDYLHATGKRERAPVHEWRIPTTHEYAQLITVSDLHYGPAEMDYARWLKLRDWIAENKHVRWVGLGDFLDTAVHDSPGMGGEGQLLSFEEARELLAADLAPIADQCFCLLAGNHEGRIANKLKLRFCPIKDLCKRLHIPYGGTSSYLRLVIQQGKREQTYDGFLHHGYGSAQTPGGKINKLYKTLEWNAVDFLAMGHTHAQVVVEQLRMALDAEVFEEDGRQWAQVGARTIPMAFGGSFLKHQSGSYSRDFGLAPASLGAADFRFYTKKKSVHGRV